MHPPSSTAAWTACSRSAAGCSPGRRDEERLSMKRTALAGWLFVAPAVLAIAAFFAVPVVAALAMSFTDFDIYALADLKNLRFVGLGNYETLLSTPLFWRALANTLLLVGIGVPLSIVA